MKDARSARLMFLIDHLQTIGPHPYGRRYLIEWITEQLDSLPSDPWDSEPGNKSMKIVIERYPALLENLKQIEENRRQSAKEFAYISYVDRQERFYHWRQEMEALEEAHVTLIRHGESAANAGRPTDDPASIQLTLQGEEQARLAAGKIDSPDLIVSSPFVRAMSTAQALRDRYPDVRFEEWPIHEFTYLDPTRCAGTTVADRREWVREYWGRSDPHHIDGPGAESFAQFLQRVLSFLHRLKSLPADHRVAVFGHGQFFNAARWISGSFGVVSQASEILERTPTPMSDFLVFDLKNHILNGKAVGLLI